MKRRKWDAAEPQTIELSSPQFAARFDGSGAWFCAADWSGSRAAQSAELRALGRCLGAASMEVLPRRDERVQNARCVEFLREIDGSYRFRACPDGL